MERSREVGEDGEEQGGDAVGKVSLVRVDLSLALMGSVSECEGAVGLACAQATAMRTHVAPHTIRRLRDPPPPHAYDPLLLLSAPARAS